MKKQTAILLITIAIASVLSCNKKEKATPKSIAVSVIVDITDSIALYPNADAVLRSYQFDKDKNTKALCRVCLITDKQLNAIEDYHLDDGVTTERDNKFDDPQHRQKLILLYYQTIRKALSDFTAIHSKDSALKHSECFKTIAGELSEMKRKHADKNTLLVFSDISENSDLFSSYTKKGKDLLFNHPEKLIAIFEQTKLLPDDLKGFNIFFVFQPKSRDEDKVYVAMSNIYKSLLEKRGARVTVQASNKNYTP